MDKRLNPYTISKDDTLLAAMKKINENRQGFLIVVGEHACVLGVLTDGDVRRGLICGADINASIGGVYNSSAQTVPVSGGFSAVVDLFKNQAIKFAPIVDESGCLVNVITKNQLHSFLLQDLPDADLSFDFSSIDTSLLDCQIFQRPWGFYKTTVLNDYYQSKVISVKPMQRLSLQSHKHREEHWIIVHGNGEVQIDDSVVSVTCGSAVFIPKGAKHRLINTDKSESLIVNEIQIGDYLGEDDIIRFEDDYGRN